MPRAQTTATTTVGPRRSDPHKPRWPFPDVVHLNAHHSGQWAKSYRVEGVRLVRYFGIWSDPKGALAEWRRRDRAIREGREGEIHERALPKRCTLRQLATAYLNHVRGRVGPNGISASMYRTERHALGALLRAVPPNTPAVELGPTEFKAVLDTLRDNAPSTVGHAVGGIRRMFKWAASDHEFPLPTFGSAFRAPKRRAFRRAHREKRDQEPIYTASEIRVMLAASGPTLRAAVFMAINGGFGASDLAAVPVSAMERRLSDTDPTGERARMSYARVKTETMRALALWPETAAAIDAARELITIHTTLLLATTEGRPLVHLSPIGAIASESDRASRTARKLPETGAGCRTDLLARQFRRMQSRTGIRGHFYLLRHTFATQAEILGESDTRRLIMGHTPMHALDETYVARHGWHRVENTCDRVREWVFGVDRADVRGPWSGVLPTIPPSWRPQPGRRSDKKPTTPTTTAEKRADKLIRERLGLPPLATTTAAAPTPSVITRKAAASRSRKSAPPSH